MIPVLTRRQILSFSAACALPGSPLFADAGFPGVLYRDYSRCLPDFLRDLAEAARERRNRELALLTSASAIAERQRWARTTFWKLAGGQPERTPLNPRKLGSFERPGYRVEKVLYESRPIFQITANLYIPTSAKPPFPGVLFQMGHSLNGKASDTYQRCCQGLAKLGYLVLAFDPMGQGERTYYPNQPLSRTRLASADEEHTLPGKQMLLLGDTSTRLQVWDAVRSLDYLAAHPLVNPKRLASTGQSGGATVTMLLAAVDDRLATAVVCSGNTENFACANFNPPGSTDDAEQNFPGAAPLGFDRWDLLYPFAPKPLLISVSDKDSFGTYSDHYISNGWEEFQQLKNVYAVLGYPDSLAWRDTPLPHGLSYDTRLEIYTWFAKWLKGESAAVKEEPPVSPEPEAVLQVSDSGNVVRSFRSASPFTLNRERVIKQRPIPVDELLSVQPAGAGFRISVLQQVPSRDVEIQAIEVPSAPKVWVPSWLFLPKRMILNKPVILVLNPAGRNIEWHEGEMYQSLAAKGYAVCAADVRGIGDLTPEYGRGAAGYARDHNDEENYSWASLILGKPLVGQRVTDILALAAGLRDHPGLRGAPLRIAALGRLTVPAIFAAALDPGIQELYLAGGLVSYRSIIETEDFTASFGNFVPNLLTHTDLPQTVASLTPRRVCLAGAVDAAQKTLEPNAVRSIYATAEQKGILEVRPTPEWTVASLAGSTDSALR